MILTEKVKQIVKDNTDLKLDIAKQLGVTQYTVDKAIRENVPDNDLTLISVIEMIQAATGMGLDEIVTKEEAAA